MSRRIDGIRDGASLELYRSCRAYLVSNITVTLRRKQKFKLDKVSCRSMWNDIKINATSNSVTTLLLEVLHPGQLNSKMENNVVLLPCLYTCCWNEALCVPLNDELQQRSIRSSNRRTYFCKAVYDTFAFLHHTISRFASPCELGTVKQDTYVHL